MDLIGEIERGLEKPGKNRAGLARALNRSPSTVTEMLRRDEKKARKIKADEIAVIREYLELDTMVQIVGSVAAGDGEVYYGLANDDPAETAPAPPGASLDTVAVEIKGASLGEGLNGWLAYYNDRREPLTSDLVGRLCVIGLADGRVLIKIPAKAPGGRFHLKPNATGETLFDCEVAWGARVIHLAPKNG